MKISTKIIIICLIFFIIITTMVGYRIGNFFYNVAINPHYDKSEVLSAAHNRISLSDVLFDPDLDKEMSDGRWFSTIGYEKVNINSYDGLSLNGYIIENNENEKKWIILSHGYGAGALQMVRIARKFYDMDFNILIPDARGHGESEGDYIGLGWHDRLDLISWINKLNNDYSEIDIVLYGVSMGGATVMMASGEDLPENVKVIIEDCGYSSIKDELAYQLRELYGLGSFPVLNFAGIVTKIRAGYGINEGSAVGQVSRSKTPMLFIHGTNDTFVPSYMLDEVYDAADVPKEKLLVKGAVHGGSAYVAGDLYWDTIENFINRFI